VGSRHACSCLQRSMWRNVINQHQLLKARQDPTGAPYPGPAVPRALPAVPVPPPPTFGLRVMWPTTGSNAPEMSCSSVDLPMPLGPTMAARDSRSCREGERE
jgi:hypothetical protein